MTEPILNPFELRGLLRKGDPGARRAFRDWATGIIEAVLSDVTALDRDWSLLTPESQESRRREYKEKLLTLGELSFTFSPELAPRQDDVWRVVRIAIVVLIGKTLSFQEHPSQRPIRHSPDIDSCQRFGIKTWFHPYTSIVNETAIHSGDWFGGRRTADGVLWILLADVSGHGLGGYLIAAGLPDLWAHYWETAPPTPAHPLDLLAWFDQKLDGCLPSDVFVEAAVARFTPTGDVTLAAVQNRAIVRRAINSLGTSEVTRSNGASCLIGLGVFAADGSDVITERLSRDDEVLLGTDGLYNALGEHRVSELLTQAITRTLQDVASTWVQVAVTAPEQPQKADDVTVIVAQYRGE
jgi:hypothetical protein